MGKKFHEMVTMVTRKSHKKKRRYFGHFSLNNTFSPPSPFLLARHQLLDFSLYWLGNAGYMLLVYIYIYIYIYIYTYIHIYTYLYIKSVSPGEHQKHLCRHTSCIPKKPKIVLLPEKNEATGLRLWHADTT